MLQAAFGHEELFVNAPKAWKASFRRVFDDITFKIQHFFLVKFQNFVENDSRPVLPYVVFYADFEFSVRFAWNYVKWHIVENICFFYISCFYVIPYIGTEVLLLTRNGHNSTQKAPKSIIPGRIKKSTTFPIIWQCQIKI